MPVNNDSVATITEERYGHEVRRKRIAFTLDSGDGSFDAVGLSIRGWIFMVVTDPGTPAPDDNYDITMTDEDGFDVMGATTQNRATATTQQAFPILVGTTYGERFVNGQLNLDITDNSTVSAEGVIDVYYRAV